MYGEVNKTKQTLGEGWQTEHSREGENIPAVETLCKGPGVAGWRHFLEGKVGGVSKRQLSPKGGGVSLLSASLWAPTND